MTDKTTKLILAAIAAGLLLNAAALWRPLPAQAQDNALATIAHDFHSIYMGTCINNTLCPH